MTIGKLFVVTSVQDENKPKRVETDQHSSSLQVNVLHDFLVEVDGFECSVIEAPQAISDAKDLVIWNTVVLQSENYVLDDIVQAWTEPSAGHYSSCHL